MQTESGDVRWSCVSPRASCQISIGEEMFEGLGYAEVLDMTIAPWLLPIRELRWGRWLSEGGSITWIDWRGPHPLSVVLNEGREVNGAVDDVGVSLGDGRRLTLSVDRVIRSGTLGATVLRALPGIRDALPPAVARTHEQKWLSRGTLSPSGQQGWAIHERVEFGA